MTVQTMQSLRDRGRRDAGELRSTKARRTGGGGTFWKAVALLLCAVQVFQLAWVSWNPAWIGWSARRDAHLAAARPRREAQASLSAQETLLRTGAVGRGGQFAALSDATESEIARTHSRLQAVCGHRGLPAGDRHHMDSRKGPTKEAVELLDHLEGLYRRKAQSPQAAFLPPQSRQRDGTAPWRDWEFSCFSQCGDDGLLYRIFGVLGWGNRRSVEIGYFPHEANSVNLIVNANFTALLLDGNTDPLVARSWYAGVPEYLDIVHENHKLPRNDWTFKEPSEVDLAKACAPFCLSSCYNVNCYRAARMTRAPYITRSLVSLNNIQSLIDSAFAKEGVSVRGAGGMDYFSIDIDGMDYYLLDSLLSNGYQPRVVATEFAAHMGQELAVTRPYSPTFSAAATSFQYGASLMAFVKLMTRYRYRFIGCVEWNAYFVHTDELADAHKSATFPQQPTETCFYQDADSKMTEIRRRRHACEVEWVEVEVPTDRKPRAWGELKRYLLNTLDTSASSSQRARL